MDVRVSSRLRNRPMQRDLNPEEEASLRRTMDAGGPPRCPRCGGDLRATPVPIPPDVSYVRRRVLLECTDCGVRTVLDQKDPT